MRVTPSSSTPAQYNTNDIIVKKCYRGEDKEGNREKKSTTYHKVEKIKQK